MATNFNLVKKPKKTDDEDFLDEEGIEEEEKKSASNNKDAKRRMILFMGFVFGGIVLLLLILYIVSLISGHNYSYEQIETVLQNAAVAYFKDYPESLPAEDGDIVEIDSSNLVAAGKMKDLSEYTAQGVICSGTVQVQKSNDSYNYVPFLNCGEQYVTLPLYQKIIENGTVSSEYGLYSINDFYAFRGENVNNYLQLETSLWRIVKINSDNQLVLILDSTIPYISRPWDNRYNDSARSSTGFNQYNNSRIAEYLDKIYKNPNEGNYEKLLSENDILKTIPFNLCTGKRTESTEGFNNTEECSETLPDQKYGLLTASEFMMASVDPNCKSTLSRSCMNYNYLSKVKDWWLATGNKGDNQHVYKVASSGYLSSELASSYSSVRPIIYLNNNVMYKDGDGSLENPYILK